MAGHTKSSLSQAAMVALNAATQTAPGVYVYENAEGPIPATIAPFNRVYYVGTATGGTANTPTQVISVDDFENVFTSSSAVNLNNLAFFFRNVPNGQFYYVKAAIAPVTTVTITNTTAGAFTVTINGTAVTYTAPASPTPTATTIITGLVTAINGTTAINTAVEAEYEINDAGASVFANSQFYIRQKNPTATAFTAVATTANLTVAAVAAPATANYWDYIYAIENSFDEDDEQGFLVCPEAFYSLTRQFERTQIANILEAKSASENYDWMALADCGTPSTIDTKAEFKTEGMLYASNRGHLAYYCPWLKDTDNDDISPALAAATVALRRYASQGFNQPPAGPQFPLRGVADVRVKLSRSEHADLNANQINVVKNLKGLGIVVYGARTRSVSPYYRFINTRIILNVYARTLYTALTNGKILFSVIDGQGVLFNRIKETADLVAYRFWSGGAFFGATPADAFLNICDRTNNPALDLEDGIIRIDSYVAPSPTAERIFVGVIRVAIDQVVERTS